MRTYTSAVMKVDGNETAKLDIFREHNTFSIYEHDMNVFSGSYTGAKNFIEDWKMKLNDIKMFLEESNHTVEFESTI